MSDESSRSSRTKLRPFSAYLKDAMDEISPDLWEWYSTYRPRQSLNASEPSSDD